MPSPADHLHEALTRNLPALDAESVKFDPRMVDLALRQDVEASALAARHAQDRVQLALAIHKERAEQAGVNGPNGP